MRWLFAILLAIFLATSIFAGSSSTGSTMTTGWDNVKANLNYSIYGNTTDYTSNIFGWIQYFLFNNSKSGTDINFSIYDESGNLVNTTIVAAGSTAANRSLNYTVYGSYSVQAISNFLNGGSFPNTTLVSWFPMSEGTGNTTADKAANNTMEIDAWNGTNTTTQPQITNLAWTLNGIISNGTSLNGINETLRINESNTFNLSNGSVGPGRNFSLAFWAQVTSYPTTGVVYLFHLGTLGNAINNDTNTVVVNTSSDVNVTQLAGSLGNLTNASINPAQNLTIVENASMSSGWNFTMNISNSSINSSGTNTSTTYDIDLYAGYYANASNSTSAANNVSVYIFNSTGWQFLANLTNGYSSWLNISNWNYTNNSGANALNATRLLFNETAAGSNGAQMVINYFGLLVHSNTTITNGTAISIMPNNTTQVRLTEAMTTSYLNLFCNATLDGKWHNWRLDWTNISTNLSEDGAQICSSSYAAQYLNITANGANNSAGYFGDGYNSANNSVVNYGAINYDEVYLFNQTITAAQGKYIFNAYLGANPSYTIVSKR